MKWASAQENLYKCIRGYPNNKGADQPAHLRSLVCAFVICYLKSLVIKLASYEISILQLVSVADETGLSLALSETLKKGFVASRPKLSFSKNTFRKSIRVSNVLDPDQGIHSSGPELDPNCLQRLSAVVACKERVYIC